MFVNRDEGEENDNVFVNTEDNAVEEIRELDTRGTEELIDTLDEAVEATLLLELAGKPLEELENVLEDDWALILLLAPVELVVVAEVVVCWLELELEAPW